MAKADDEVEQLFRAVRHGSNRERMAAVESLARRKIQPQWWPMLRELIRAKQYGLAVPRFALVAAGKMKNPPPEALDEVIAAAKPGYQGMIPQYFAEAVVAAIAISPNDPRLPDVLAHGLTIDNYQLQKAAAEGLMKIDSPAAREILATIRQHLPREYTEQLVVRLLERVDRHLASAS
ncbi:MAG: hypothetical protein KDB14_04600 [Planctomycetales bacterium]|nr:hypothetical protein [Planctomycetales bacterium]